MPALLPHCNRDADVSAPHESAASDPVEATLVRPHEARAMLRSRRRYHLAMLLIAGGVLVLSLLLQMPGEEQVELPFVGVKLPGICAWRNMFGFDCPGCGLTRSFVCLAHGEPQRAWFYNPAGLLLFGVLLAQFPYRLWQLRRIATRGHDWQSGWLTAVLWLAVTALLVQWLTKMLLGRLW